MVISRTYEQLQGTSMDIDESVNLRTAPSAAGSNTFIFRMLQRRSTVLMNPYICSINEAQLTFGPLDYNGEERFPEAPDTPLSEPTVYRAPWAILAWHVSPWTSGAEDVDDAFDDFSQVASRSAAGSIASVRGGFGINFFSFLQVFSGRPRWYFGFMELR